MSLANYIKSADWKAEKHVPVITAPSSIAPGVPFDVEVSVGKEIPHPNTIEHHISWIALYYIPADGQFPIELARANFSAHGPQIHTEPILKATISLPSPTPTLPSNSTQPPTPTRISNSSFTLHAAAYCNIHGLWESETKLGVFLKSV